MSAPAIRAVSSGQTTSVTSIACTHPTGLTAGDLMVLFVGTYNGGADRTISTPSGWTSQEFVTGSNDLRRNLIAFKKVATAGDVSAGSTTVSFSGTVEHSAFGCYAITGAASGSEITLSEGDYQELTTSFNAVVTFTTALTPVVNNSLVIVSYYSFVFDPNGTVLGSDYTITPSATFTENVDIGDFVGGTSARSLMCASAPYTGLSQITSRSVTLSRVGTSSQDTNGIILIVNAPQNQTADVSRLEVPPTLFGVTGSNTATADVSRIDITPELHSLEAKSSTQGTQWINDIKPTTTWTNNTI